MTEDRRFDQRLKWILKRLIFAALAASCALAGAGDVVRAAPGSGGEGPVDPEPGVSRSFPDTSSRISVFAPSLPGSLTEAQLNFVAEHFAGAEQLSGRDIAKIRLLNPSFLNLQARQAFIGSNKPYFLGDVWGTDWPTIQGRSEWYMRAEDGEPMWNLLAGGYLMRPWDDFARFPAYTWPAYWVDTSMDQMRRMAGDGIRAQGYNPDAAYGALLDPFDEKFRPERIEQSWITLVNKFGRYVADRFSATPEHFLLVVDGGPLADKLPTADFSVADGVVVQDFAGGLVPLSLESWKTQMNRVLALQQTNQAALCRSTLPDGAEPDSRFFRLASYLLVKASHAFLYLRTEHATTLEYFPEYSIQLGRFVSATSADVETYFRNDLGLYAREYELGIVLVNPGDGPVRLRLERPAWNITPRDGGAVDETGFIMGSLLWEKVEELNLEPGNGAILVYDQGAARPGKRGAVMRRIN